MTLETRHSDLKMVDMLADVSTSWDKMIRDQKGWLPQPHPYVYASGRCKCVLQMVRDMVEPDKRDPFGEDTLFRFKLGDDRERDIRADLELVGRNNDPPFSVEGHNEPVEIKGKYDKGLQDVTIIKGKIEGHLNFPTLHEKWDMEIKSWAPYLVDNVRVFDDLFNNKWTKKGALQLLIYMYAKNHERGVFILDRRGRPKLLPVNLHDWLNEIEAFLSDAESAVKHAAAGTFPDYTDDPRECARCDYAGKTCFPPLMSRDSELLKVFNDPDLEDAITRHQELHEPHLEYNNIHKTLASTFRGIQNAACGNYLITGEFGSGSKVELPPAVKKRRKIQDDKYRVTVEEHRWRMSVDTIGVKDES